MLDDAMVGGLRPSMLIYWERKVADSDTPEPEDLTGAVLSGWLLNRGTETLKPITGTLTVTEPLLGEFLWELSEGDVDTAGDYDVEFQATYADGPSPAKTFPVRWRVLETVTGVA